ncbi:uncharacterized protein LOC119525357 isoform X2 [Choloepus didactylus]|uniref:uncharacterized protein LOC119525357 isoform X2 n=1 Tax=Choloepus didactylus TaxID=27675 RepID=UPI0018A06FD9|nr:uncharacterized protein LOC119525357 isoform X2 [Choloepus didactylus]
MWPPGGARPGPGPACCSSPGRYTHRYTPEAQVRKADPRHSAGVPDYRRAQSHKRVTVPAKLVPLIAEVWGTLQDLQLNSGQAPP